MFILLFFRGEETHQWPVETEAAAQNVLKVLGDTMLRNTGRDGIPRRLLLLQELVRVVADPIPPTEIEKAEWDARNTAERFE
jgi:hypothetical protein